jgi:hypothetical protein
MMFHAWQGLCRSGAPAFLERRLLFHRAGLFKIFRSTRMTQYEMQVSQADIRMLIVAGDNAIEMLRAASVDGKPYAALHTDSLAELNGWREVLQAGGRPHRLVNHAYGYRQEVNNPDW